MFGYVIHKLWKRKWMAISLVIGNLLLIGMVVGSIVYSNAVLNRVLVKDLNQYMNTTETYPLQAKIDIRMNNTRSDGSIAGRMKQMEKVISDLPEEMQLIEKEIVTMYNIKTNYLFTPEDEESGEYVLDLAFLSDLDEHSTVLSGNMYQKELVDGAIEVVVSRKTMMEKNLMIGDELYLADAPDQQGHPYKIRVVGVFHNTDQTDAYWVKSPDQFTSQFFMDEELFRSLFVNYENPQYKWNTTWNVLLDYDNIKAEQVDHILGTLEEFQNTIKEIDYYYYIEYFSDLLQDFQTKQIKLQNILFLLEVPIFILLMIFIYMVNNQMMLLERNDIAILKSRGASDAHIMYIYLLQGIIIGILGLTLGIPLGLFFCYVLGNANAFLEFVSRTALPLELTPTALTYAFFCVFASLGMTLVMAFFHTRETIVSSKRRKKKSNDKNALWSFLLGAIFLAIAFYSRYSFNLHADALAMSSETGTGVDPLLFFSSTFFIVGATFFVLGLFPMLLNLLFYIGKKRWNPAFYAAFQQVVKGSNNQGFIILFLILTVSLGIFDATLARTINGNEEERLVYSTGADLVFQEKWYSNKESIQVYISTMQSMGQILTEDNFDIFYVEPNFNRYTELNDVQSATKVLMNHDIQVSVSKGKINATLMGINSKEFGETAYFKTDLLDQHWYHYLNEIAADEDGIIVSSNFRDVYDYKMGDTLAYYDKDRTIKGTIQGFVDYWPSYQPIRKEINSDGVVKDTEQFLIVANLSKVQSVWGITPYQVWMRTKDSTSFFYDFAAGNQVQFEEFNDLSAQIIDKNNDPFFQGTNGVLTLGFIIILLICAVGFLIFWIFSILSRTLQFGVFRAMGMTKGEILLMLLCEQFFLSVIPIAFGLLIGRIVSKLFVPLIQVAYTSSEQILPLEIINQGSDQGRILAIVGFMVVLCMIIIGKLISDMKVTQALKLGED